MSIKIYVKYVKNNRDFYTTKMNLPTGNLDSKNSQDVIDLLTKASRHYQQTILMITHNNGLTSMVDRVLRVTDGVLTDLGGNANEKLS
jgi:putative ABC transport system ATP-binding protein